MPIGKNALKRVSNNGYSNVTATAPDMENSVIVEPIAQKTEEKPAAKKVSKPAAKKTEAKKTETKAVSAKAQPKKNTAPKSEKPKAEKPEIEAVKIEKPEISESTETSHPDGFVKVSCGMDMPAYLL